MYKKKFGKLGELFAKHYLVLKGYKIIETNYLVSKYGEIDIIAIKDKTIYFVEVKTRTKCHNKMYVNGIYAVNKDKLKNIKYAMNVFLKHSNMYSRYKKSILTVSIDISMICVY